MGGRAVSPLIVKYNVDKNYYILLIYSRLVIMYESEAVIKGLINAIELGVHTYN